MPKRGERWSQDEARPRSVKSPHLPSGMARCAECGAAMIGRTGRTGRRNWPCRAYLCGRKVREGWSSCTSGKIRAEGPEIAVVQFVIEQVLTPDFVTTLVADVNGRLDRDEPTVQAKLKETQRQLAEVEQAISVLLDLAEQFGAASAGTRWLEREAV